MALTLSGMALASGFMELTCTGKTGGERRSAHKCSNKVRTNWLTPPGSP